MQKNQVLSALLSIVLTGFTFVIATAQDSTRTLKKAVPASVEPMSEFITLKLAQSSDLENFSLFTPTVEYQINPNSISQTTLSANYSFISASVNFAPRFFPGNRDNTEKGKTRSRGLALNFYFNHWLQELSYTRTKGYYLENTASFLPNWEDGDPYIQFPDLVYKNFQGMTGYKFNRKFSMNALASQSERQLNSAGSFIPQLLYRYYILDDRTKLLNPGQSTQRSNSMELVLGAGYYHTFVLKRNIYFALGLTPGFGYLFMQLNTRETGGTSYQTHQRHALARIDSRIGLGYNGKRIFGGLYATAFVSSYQETEQVVNGNARLFFKLFFGYRIPAPSVLIEKVTLVKQKLNQTIQLNKP